MTDDLRSLRLLLAQAERQRDEALAEQLKLDAACRAAAAQAEQLRALSRASTSSAGAAQFCREGKIELVRCYQGFIERLTPGGRAAGADRRPCRGAGSSAPPRSCAATTCAPRR